MENENTFDVKSSELFARISARLYMDEKWLTLVDENPKAACLWINSICYTVSVADKNSRDGFVSRFMAYRFLNANNETVKALVNHRMWEPTKGGWLIHGWSEWQRGKKDLEEIRSVRAAAGRRSGVVRRLKASNKRRTSVERLFVNKTNKNEPDTDTDTDTDTFTSSSTPLHVVSIDQWKPDEKEKEEIYDSHHIGHEDGDCTLIGMRQWWQLNHPNAKRTPQQWRALADGWFTNPRSLKHAHRHTWLCVHTLQAAHLTRDQASEHVTFLEYVAAGLNKGYPPGQAVRKAEQATAEKVTEK